MTPMAEAVKDGSRKRPRSIIKDSQSKNRKRVKGAYSVQPVPPMHEASTSVTARLRHRTPKSTRSNEASDVASEKNFRYKPLDTTKQEIRLCQILPVDPHCANDTIQCKITHHILDAPADSLYLGLDLSYIAVSYCWVDASDTQTILNGQEYQVGKNLYAFLQTILDNGQDEGVYFWIEKLYESEGWHILQSELQSLLNGWPEFDVAGIFLFFTRDYWKRVWIVQEVFLAHQLFLLCSSSLRQQIRAPSIWRDLLHGSGSMRHVESTANSYGINFTGDTKSL